MTKGRAECIRCFKRLQGLTETAIAACANQKSAAIE
jgi:hypothetical protein